MKNTILYSLNYFYKYLNGKRFILTEIATGSEVKLCLQNKDILRLVNDDGIFKQVKINEQEFKDNSFYALMFETDFTFIKIVNIYLNEEEVIAKPTEQLNSKAFVTKSRRTIKDFSEDYNFITSVDTTKVKELLSKENYKYAEYGNKYKNIIGLLFEDGEYQLIVNHSIYTNIKFKDFNDLLTNERFKLFRRQSKRQKYFYLYLNSESKPLIDNDNKNLIALYISPSVVKKALNKFN